MEEGVFPLSELDMNLQWRHQTPLGIRSSVHFQESILFANKYAVPFGHDNNVLNC